MKVAGLKEFRTAIEQQGANSAVSEQLSDLLERLLAAVAQHTLSADVAETKRLKNIVHALGERLRDALAAHESLPHGGRAP